MRLQSLCFRGVKEISGNDFRITITHNDKICSVRIVRVVLKSGEVETLITNLLENELDTDKFRELYFLRWSIETSFDTLKNKFLIEKFSGKSFVAVFQEYYSIMFLITVCLQ
ncbi:MAG: transposase [Ruminococcus sp.]|nr:transposase [Ruminococcus sp.]